MGVLVQGGGGRIKPDFRLADRPAGSPAGLSTGQAGQPRVQPDFRPFFRPKKGGGDGLNRKVRRADKSAEPQVRFNPLSWNNAPITELPHSLASWS